MGIARMRALRQMDETTLRKKAGHAIQTGKIPMRRPDRMWGGSGNGADCVVCGAPVGSDELGFELEFSARGAPVPAALYAFHATCFAAWELEREDVRLNRGTLSSDESSGTIADRERDSTFRRGSV